MRTKNFKHFAIALAVVAVGLTGYSVVNAQVQIADNTSGGGLTCNGKTDCPHGHSAEMRHGKITSCCGNNTPNMTGHYHS